MKRLILYVLAAFIFITPAAAVDFTFTANPAVNIQLNKQMPIGFSGFLQGDVNIANFMTVGLEGNYTLVKPEGFVKPIQLYGGGLNLGFYYFPLSRLYTGLGGGFGPFFLWLDNQ